MLFKFRIMNKTVKELRKNQGLTVRELAELVKLDSIEVLRVDDKKLKEVPEPIKGKLFPILSGEYLDRIPWL